jgi:predicted transcriptional regulator
MTTVPVPPLAVLPRPRPAPAAGLPPRQGAVLAVLWEAPHPLSAAQISARLAQGTGAATGIYHALHQLRAAGLITATWAGRAHSYEAAVGRDSYLADLVATALDQADNSVGVLRAALFTPPDSP